MAELKNEFSWSPSRARLFNECRRKYYFNYYGAWNGWKPEGPESARLCYRLKQIVDLNTWAGDIVHRVIEMTLKRIRRGQDMPPGSMLGAAKRMLNEEWRESNESLWLRAPKNYRNLFEHYYRREVTAEMRAALRDKIFAALNAFEEMGYGPRLRALPGEAWRGVEELKSFDVAGVKVWVKIDCAFDDEGLLRVLDWKTGRAPEDDGPPDQLVCYALYALQEWNVPLETVRVAPVYLCDRRADECAISPEQIIEFRERLFQSADAMRALLSDPRANAGVESDFPRTEEKSRCARCAFFEACYGDRSLAPPSVNA